MKTRPLAYRPWAYALAALLLAAASGAQAARPWNCQPGSFGTGPGKLTTEDRTPTETFTSIGLSNGACVEYIQGDKVSVKVESEPEILKELEILVENGSLKIRDKKNGKWFSWNSSGNGNKVLRVVVTAPQLAAVAVAGSGDVVNAGMKAGDLKFSVAGSGDIHFKNLSAAAVAGAVAGSGDIKVHGKAQSLKASIAGSGDIDSSGLEAETVSVSIAGSGDAKVWASSTLSVSIAGSGDVAYKGSPTVKKSVVGAGSIKQL